jgi:hypothetical protein
MVFIAGNLIFAGLSAAAFYLTGRAVSIITGLRTEGTAERLAIYPTLGMSVYALGFMALGFAGLYRDGVAYAALGLGLATALVQPKVLLEEIRETINRFLSAATVFSYPIRPILTWAVLLLSLVLLVVALLPQLWLDVLIYRLTLPLKYIIAGGIYYVPDIRASSFPQYHEQLNLFGMLLFSTRLPALFVVLTWNITLVTVYAGARRIYGKEAGFYAGAIFLTVPFVLAILPYGVNDHLWAMYFAVSMYLLLRWSDGGSWRDLVFSGFFAGFALGVKILHLFLFPAYLFVLIVSFLRRRLHITRCSAVFFVFVTLFFAIASPWFIRNYVHTGDLLGFIADDYKQVSDWRGEETPGNYLGRGAWFAGLPTFRGPGSDVWGFIKTPVSIMTGRTTWGSMNGIGLLIYPGLVLSLFVKRRFGFSAVIIATSVLLFLIWVYFMKALTPRYLYPALTVAAVAGGGGFTWALNKPGGTWKVLSRAGFLVLTAGTLFLTRYTFLYLLRDVPISLRPDLHYQYVLDNLYGGEDLPLALSELPKGSKVLSVDDRIYYIVERGAPLHVGYPLNSYYFDYSAAENPEDMLKRITAKGFTHVLYWKVNGDFLFPGSPWGGDPRHEQYHFLYDFLEVYGVPAGGEDGDGVFGPDRLYELRNEPVRPPRPASERTGEGFDYPLERTPEAFRIGNG